ncbi:hypothetical protein SAMN05444002_2373 [Vannielia litorea]|uniref:Uncharacterized protein n=1 Tax=Vannielia litorea TaxID=1217970 RepID=A0A1N6GCE9_9RHOB|nr:hypothetical protein SAMN05444002_2373 [Vannielia litorea]
MRNATPSDPYSSLLQSFFYRHYGAGEARLFCRIVGEARA